MFDNTAGYLYCKLRHAVVVLGNVAKRLLSTNGQIWGGGLEFSSRNVR